MLNTNNKNNNFILFQKLGYKNKVKHNPQVAKAIRGGLCKNKYK